ncbi:hypothetical protein [Paenibacillus sp. Marseille-Q4541]|uniref:hypothetical protein n=1 Tax=Paenibacillus sp. Marseille-Q4541 TaxID=2831522 RepID=UPI001BA60922|nr:hypothetical protein [Paenibacillus sp. Marseille-Q4541]
MNHPHKQAVAQCRRCGKPLCEECYDPATGYCLHHCTPNGISSTEEQKGKKSVLLQVLIAILAIIGGLTVLLISICGALLLSY